jgi:DnaJ-class molecular chaperone
MSPLVSTADDRVQSCGSSRCPVCGGSGLLRVGDQFGDQRYRTCLDCLGQGRCLPMTGDGLFVRMVSVASASAAR